MSSHGDMYERLLFGYFTVLARGGERREWAGLGEQAQEFPGSIEGFVRNYASGRKNIESTNVGEHLEQAHKEAGGVRESDEEKELHDCRERGKVESEMREVAQIPLGNTLDSNRRLCLVRPCLRAAPT